MIDRRDFLRAGLAAGAASVVSGRLPAARGPGNAMRKSKPNIIFIFADDWGYGDLGIHGSTFCKTPNLDRMAKEGIDFQQFTVNNPVCSPSRTAVMTGQFPARHCIHQHFASVEHHMKAGMPDWLDPKLPLLSRLLKKAGYVTGHFGKWHLTNRHIPDAPLPTEYGYDEYGAFNVPGVQIKTAETCPRTVDFIHRHKNQPFFINVWLHETHTPHYPLEKYLKQFQHLDEQKQVYAAVVAEGDAGVGSILSTLKKLGLATPPDRAWARTTRSGKRPGSKVRNAHSLPVAFAFLSLPAGQGSSRKAGWIELQFLPLWTSCLHSSNWHDNHCLTVSSWTARASQEHSKGSHLSVLGPFTGNGAVAMGRLICGLIWAFAAANGD